jgi:hypothetical protein
MQNESATFGKIERTDYFLKPSSPAHYAISGADDKLMFRLIPKVGHGYKNIKYEIMVPGKGAPIGWIKKGWKDYRSGPQTHGVSFPADLPPMGKTLLVGAAACIVS